MRAPPLGKRGTDLVASHDLTGIPPAERRLQTKCLTY
jgi:hypothetical protein